MAWNPAQSLVEVVGESIERRPVPIEVMMEPKMAQGR